MQDRVDLQIAKLIGQPINEQLPVPVEIRAIADIFTAKAGEHTFDTGGRPHRSAEILCRKDF